MNKNKTLQAAIMVLKVLVGVTVYSAGFTFFTYRNNIVSGGITGIAMIITRFWNFPVGTLVAILNIPLFIYARKKLGRKFMIVSLIVMLLNSALIDLFSLVRLDITNELLLASLYGGVLRGLGMGLVYSTGATGGGADIVAKLVRKNSPHINLGTIIMMLDVLIILIYAIIFGSYDIAMYAIISSVVYGQVVDFVLYGTVNSKTCYIITDRSEEAIALINERLSRGATMLHARGAYYGNEKEVILCVLKHQQIVELRRMLAELDEHAFLIVSDARQVYGSGFGSIDSDE